MKMTSKREPEDTMRKEYDFTVGTRGKYAKKVAKGTNIVILDPDVAKLFKDSESVNDALRLLGELARRQIVRRRK